MSDGAWILDTLGAGRLEKAVEESSRRRIAGALGRGHSTDDNEAELRFVANILELRAFDLLETEHHQTLQKAALEAFQLARTLHFSSDPLSHAQDLVRTGCFGVLGDRPSDVYRWLKGTAWPSLANNFGSWGERVTAYTYEIWLRLLRKDGWDDLNGVNARIGELRAAQNEEEPQYLIRTEENRSATPAWRLISQYHLAKAAELLGTYIGQGSIDGKFNVREQLEAQFDRAVSAAEMGQQMELEVMARLLSRTARALVDNSIWTVTRAVNSRVTKFVEHVTDRSQRSPIFQVLPPQRKTLREEGLLGSGHRTVVVCLPTSSGKTFIAQFRILQALNQFDQERGWVAYIAPTRALVNQITMRLRRDFAGLDVEVEKVNPALEVDGLEAGMLAEPDVKRQFRILVMTPEKLDMLLRGGWEQKIGRPLTLVVVDEAHGLSSGSRGLKLELLLASINRECRYAQFLLLTPFITNAKEIAQWLSPESNKDIELSVEWSPNDRVIALAKRQKGQKQGDFTIVLETLHTSRPSLRIPESLQLTTPRPLGLTWSDAKAQGKLAAATANSLQSRGTVIVLVGKPNHSWGVANSLKVESNRIDSLGSDMALIKQFLTDEMGQDFPIADLLDYGIGVHHSGLSEDCRLLMEWLTETGQLRVLVATTTIAQGVNFPVSAVVFASHQYPYGKDMPPEDFWNIAGRVGRVDQYDLGIVALAASTPDKEGQLREFVGRSTIALNSTLIEMVRGVMEGNRDFNLSTLSPDPQWSSFVQYLAHTYRLAGGHQQFASEVEEVLRGTFGFQVLRRSNRGWADKLVQSVAVYAEKLQSNVGPVKLVDSTGFSLETVLGTLGRIRDVGITSNDWTPELFGGNSRTLRHMMGVLLQVPELRENLADVTRGPQPDGNTLARITCDWVNGRSLRDMAETYFSKEHSSDNEESDAVASVTRCCHAIFSRLTQTASWGLSALQSLTLGDSLETKTADEQRMIRNIPARVYYGVDSDEAVALRLLGVPRNAARPLCRVLGVSASESLNEVRAKLRAASNGTWNSALGDRGECYHKAWRIIEGEVN